MTRLNAALQAELAAGSHGRERDKYDPLKDLLRSELPLRGPWPEVAQQMLRLEALCGPVAQRASPNQVMKARGGQAFAAALMDFQRLALAPEAFAHLHEAHADMAQWMLVRS
ncbi:hypothetical protein HaLaN_04106 [Haematococcus lacustris]|uniref:Uncharacterized protein n=1 Tax=Haematococcus lacustris TaxID=44745 RepID=A0A699YRZ3_HAELA|nr:hypothetical protein HaLaN_04106 [Haematococcus lacustris]